jgi:hypothetical protein
VAGFTPTGLDVAQGFPLDAREPREPITSHPRLLAPFGYPILLLTAHMKLDIADTV